MSWPRIAANGTPKMVVTDQIPSFDSAACNLQDALEDYFLIIGQVASGCEPSASSPVMTFTTL